MFDFDALSKVMVRQTVLCVGDLMLDEFVYGEVSRISPEAPASVLAVKRSETSVGGAGNVARNITSLGARCIFVSLVGRDAAGEKLGADLASEKLIEPALIVDSDRPTTRKVRFVSEHFSTHMLRADWEIAAPASEGIERQLIDTAVAALPRADIVLLSDYAKGVLTARVVRHIIDAARKLGKRVIVDPKSANLAIYRGATLLTPNQKEFAEATRRRIHSDEDIADASIEALRSADAEAVLVTLSEQGMTLAHRDGNLIHVPAQPAKVRDVSGAGDTVVAVLAVALAARQLGRCVALCDSRRRRRGQQAGNGDGFARRTPPQDSAARIAHGGRKDRLQRRRSRCAGSRMAQAGAARRLHQWLF
jgi:D-beta-D-heptose 7-phosphate kinase/D-beta-D-heptose 1-phosphate adenosyltransferase